MSALPPQARFSIAVIEDTSNRVLFLKRATDRVLGPNQWGFPAGHIEPGETPAECVARELCEEIGRRNPLREIRRLGPIRDTCYGGIYEIHLFHYYWDEGQITLNVEHTAFAWITLDAYRRLDVMDGIDEDLALLEVWPRAALNQARLPAYLRRC